MIEHARRAKPTVTSDWMPIEPVAIGGVRIKEIRNVTIRSGVLTECFRPEWFDPEFRGACCLYVAAAGRRFFLALTSHPKGRDCRRSWAIKGRLIRRPGSFSHVQNF